MRKVLITGVSGLLGANLAFKFKDKYSVTGLYNAHKPLINGVRAVKCDLAGDRIHVVVRDVCPEVVIHCAALTDVDYCEQHPEEAYRINAESSGQIARAAEATGSKMVFI